MRTIGRLATAAVTRTLAAATLLAFFLSSGCAGVRDGPAAGQELVFFPSPVSMSTSEQWSLTVQGRIFEPTEQSVRREMLISHIAPLVGVNSSDVEESKIFRERARFFLSDSERNYRVAVKIGEATILLPPSDSAGYFTADVPLTNAKVAQLAKAGIISFESVPTDRNPRPFRGLAVLVPEAGVTVVSDIDDTIKTTNIRDHKEKVAYTFLRPFVAVPGMAELYRSWQTAFGPRIQFHIVSAGPWQLNEPLRRFTEEAGFPPFTWTMRSVDIGNPAVVLSEISADPYDFKVQAIRALIARFPKRQLVLVGDSGEKDPEVYAKIISEFPDLVRAAYIRNVTGEDCNAARYQDLFPGRAAAKLNVFRLPQELPPLTPSSAGMALCASTQ